jgi:hypothetical protein
MASLKAEVYADFLDQIVSATITAAKNVAEGNRLRVVQEGKAHPLWSMGHLANTNDRLLNQWCCEGASMIPESYGKLFSPDFAGGAPITTNADDYPSWDEVVEVYAKVSKACVEGIRTLDDSVLAGALRGSAPDALKEKFPSVEYTIRAITAHDAYHRGQMNAIAALA